jgi:hypothetical protein
MNSIIEGAARAVAHSDARFDGLGAVRRTRLAARNSNLRKSTFDLSDIVSTS